AGGRPRAETPYPVRGGTKSMKEKILKQVSKTLLPAPSSFCLLTFQNATSIPLSVSQGSGSMLLGIYPDPGKVIVSGYEVRQATDAYGRAVVTEGGIGRISWSAGTTGTVVMVPII